jgi:hypothetical protein
VSSKKKGGKKPGAGKKPGPKWTPMLRAFVEALKEGKDQTNAARAAGYKNANTIACRLMRKPLVIAAMAEHAEIQRKAAERAADDDARKPIITKRRIEEILANIAENGENDHVKVRAAMGLAEIKGMKVQRNLDLGREFEGKTEEELDFFGIHGYFPDEHLVAGKPGPTGMASEGPPPASPNQKR